VFLATPRNEVHLLNSYVQNASGFPVDDAWILYYESGGISAPEDLGMIMPDDTVSADRQSPPMRPEVLNTVIVIEARSRRHVGEVHGPSPARAWRSGGKAQSGDLGVRKTRTKPRTNAPRFCRTEPDPLRH
jgi:hypothetical protein